MTAPDPLAALDLKSLFCERFKCDPSQFEQCALRKCLYFHAWLISPLLRWLNPKCFERDLLFIDYFGKSKNWRDVNTEIAAFHYQDFTKPRFVRRTLRLRASGQKANLLASKLFPEKEASKKEC